MVDAQQNVVIATQTATYYDHLWSSLGTELHYTEVNRMRFVVDSIREFVGCTDLKILDFGCGRG